MGRVAAKRKRSYAISETRSFHFVECLYWYQKTVVQMERKPGPNCFHDLGCDEPRLSSGLNRAGSFRARGDQVSGDWTCLPGSLVIPTAYHDVRGTRRAERNVSGTRNGFRIVGKLVNEWYFCTSQKVRSDLIVFPGWFIIMLDERSLNETVYNYRDPRMDGFIK